MIIREMDLFKGLGYEVMNKIAAICSEENYSKGIVMFRNNDKADSLYILVRGTVHLEVKNGGTLTYSFNAPGEVFGWSSMFEHGRYTASGICATDVKVVKIAWDNISPIFTEHPDAGLKFLRRLGNVFSRRLANAYHDLLTTRSTVTGASIWKDDNIIPQLQDEPLFELQDSWHNF